MLYIFIGILFTMLLHENSTKTNLMSEINQINSNMLMNVGKIIYKFCSTGSNNDKDPKITGQSFINDLKTMDYEVIINTELIRHYQLSKWFFLIEIIALFILFISGIIREFNSVASYGLSLYIIAAFLSGSIVILRLFFLRYNGKSENRFKSFKQNLIGKKDEN